MAAAGNLDGGSCMECGGVMVVVMVAVMVMVWWPGGVASNM